MNRTESLLGKILIVDDELRNLTIIEELLLEYEVETAHSGVEALQKMDSFRPDVVLLDIMMPGMDGYEVCRRIRRRQEFRFTKVIFVSGKTLIEDRLAGYDAGGDDYVTKPFDHDELRAKVGVYLRLKSVEEVSQIKSDFLRFISGETVKPLTALLDLAKLIARDRQLSQDQVVGYAEKVHAHGQTLLTFMERTLRLCLGKSQVNFHPSLQSLSQVVHAAISNLKGDHAHDEVRFSVEVPNEIVSCDRELLEKAFEYVLENTASKIPRPRVITVKGEKADRDFTVSIDAEGSSTSEAPAGAAESERDDFQSRWQELSLAIARRVAELHSGTLRVESEGAAGTKFLFRLPVNQSFSLRKGFGNSPVPVSTRL